MSAAEELNDEDSMLKFFGSELVRLRAAKGVGQIDLAAATHCTQAMVSKIENAKRVPSKEFAHAADDFFGADGHLLRLWPLVIKYAYPSWFRPYVELEKQAAIIRSFQTMVIPGLLQTRAYARATLEVGRTLGVDALLDARMERQAILERPAPPELWVVLDENVVRRRVGDGTLMRDQLQRLIDASEQPNTVIQVVPFGTGIHAGIEGPFSSLTFAEGHPVVYADGFYQGQILADLDAIKAATRTYDLLMGAALPVPASVDLIADVMKELSQ